MELIVYGDNSETYGDNRFTSSGFTELGFSINRSISQIRLLPIQSDCITTNDHKELVAQTCPPQARKNRDS